MALKTAMAARAVQSNVTSTLNEPLLNKRETPTQVTVHTGEDDENGDDVQVSKGIGTVLLTSVVCVAAAGAIAASAAAMITIQSIAVFVAGGLCCLNAPTVVHRHLEISKAPGELHLPACYTSRCIVIFNKMILTT